MRILILVAMLVAAQVGEAQTREQRRAEKARREAVKATQATQMRVKAGKIPSYNKLLKSTDYELMFREGLRYYGLREKKSGRVSHTNLRKAQTLFEQAIRSQAFYGKSNADSLYYFYGCSFFMAQDFQSSQDVFDRFRREYAASPFVEDAEYKFAMGFYFLAPEPRYDQSVTARAISAITEYMGRYPGTEHGDVCEARVVELRRKLYEKSYENAKLYYKIGQYKAAVRALGNAIDKYPESPYREELMYLATKSAYLYAKNSVERQQVDRYMAMMDNYYNLISEFPTTAHLREVEGMRDEALKYIKKDGE